MTRKNRVMEDVNQMLKRLEPITIMTICTKERAQSNKYLVNDEGLALYGDDWITPEELMSRFRVDTPMLTPVAAEVMNRTIEPHMGRSYRWHTIRKIEI